MNGWLSKNEFQARLISDGWRTPDTYDRYYRQPPEQSGIYLFLLIDMAFSMTLCRPAYVGMSRNIRARWCGHEILKCLRERDEWTQRWFMTVKEPELRAAETAYIEAFNPPWNLACTKRGLMA